MGVKISNYSFVRSVGYSTRLAGFVFLAAVALYLFQVQPNKTLAGKLGSDEDYSSHLGQQQSFLRVCPRSSLQDHAAQGDCLPRRMMRWPVYFL